MVPNRQLLRLSHFRFGCLAVSREASSSGITSSTWLDAQRLRQVVQRHHGRIAPAPLETTHILLREPESSAKRSWVKPFASRSLAKFRPTSLRMSMRAS